MQDINQLRQLFDALDDELIQLLVQRLNLSETIGNVKAQLNLPIEDLDREHLINQKIKKHTLPEHTEHIVRIYHSIISESKKIQAPND